MQHIRIYERERERERERGRERDILKDILGGKEQRESLTCAIPHRGSRLKQRI